LIACCGLRFLSQIDDLTQSGERWLSLKPTH
jgi:hypothetical protein